MTTKLIRDTMFARYFPLIDELTIPYSLTYKLKRSKLFEVANEGLMNAVGSRGTKLTRLQATKAINKRIVAFHNDAPTRRTDCLDLAIPVSLGHPIDPNNDDSPTVGEQLSAPGPSPE